MSHHLGIAAFIFGLLFAPSLYAQADLEDSSAASGSDVEALYDKDEEKVEKTKVQEEREKKATKEVNSLSDLATLAPFSDVAVIQKRFLPKSKRFEVSGGAFTNLNNPFFNSIGLSGRLAYYLTEKWAIEGIGAFATTTSRQVTDDLETDRGVTTDNVLTSKGYFVGAIKWNPIYGKITWLNKSIVPFDLNFNLGGGTTMTTDGENLPTLHMSTSQVFAWSKGMAFRWDLVWNMYSGEATAVNGRKETLMQNDLFLGIGMSFYFPEATYR